MNYVEMQIFRQAHHRRGNKNIPVVFFLNDKSSYLSTNWNLPIPN